MRAPTRQIQVGLRGAAGVPFLMEGFALAGSVALAEPYFKRCYTCFKEMPLQEIHAYNAGMEFEHYAWFVDVMRRGSFAAVARDRNIDPSTVSRGIATLEKALGLRLFHRTTRRLTPTEAGRVYFERIEPLIEEFDNARLAAADLGAKPRGTLRVLAPVSFALLNIVPLLPEFVADFPDLKFDLVLTDALLDLVEERIDMAVRLGPLEDSGLIAQRLSPMVSRVCASPAYLERRGRPAWPRDLTEHECLALEMPGFSDRWLFRDAAGEVVEVPVSGPLRTSNAIALKEGALGGLGIILQGRWIVGRELARGQLIDLFPDFEATASSFDNSAWILYPSRAYLPLKVRVFVDFLHRRFRPAPPWDQN